MKCCVVKDVDPGETSEGIRKRRGEGATQECDFKQDQSPPDSMGSPGI